MENEILTTKGFNNSAHYDFEGTKKKNIQPTVGVKSFGWREFIEEAKLQKPRD